LNFFSAGLGGGQVDMEYLAGGLPLLLGRTLSEMLSVSWTSAHHTPVDITLAAAGPHATNLPVTHRPLPSQQGNAIPIS
jgi:uncharacterized protein YejL (UPF0352 family)